MFLWAMAARMARNRWGMSPGMKSSMDLSLFSGRAQPFVGGLFPYLYRAGSAVGKDHGPHQGTVDRFKVVEGDLPRVQVDITDHKIMCQSPLLQIGEAVGFALAVCAADTEMVSVPFVQGRGSPVKNPVELFFPRSEPLNPQGVKQTLPETLHSPAKIKIGCAVDLIAKCLFIHGVGSGLSGSI